MTHVPETGTRKMESIYGAGFQSMCHGYQIAIMVPKINISTVSLSYLPFLLLSVTTCTITNTSAVVEILDTA